MASTVYKFDVVPDQLEDKLSFIKSVDQVRAQEAIDYAAGTLTRVIKVFVNVDPSTITATAAPEDYNDCRNALLDGAVAEYVWLTTGTTESVQAKADAFTQFITDLREMPNMLSIYSPDTGINAMQTHRTRVAASSLSDNEAAKTAALLRRETPANIREWEST